MESILSGHDGERNDPSMDFDTLFDTKALRIMRVLIPFFPVPYQPLLAVWMRFAQLKYALTLLKDKHFMHDRAKTSTPDENLFEHLLPALKPCLSESEYQELIRMQNLFSMYQRFQQIMPYLSALSGMSGNPSAEDMMNLFHTMQGGENASASDMMNAFSAMQGGEGFSASDILGAFSAMQGSNGSSHTDTVNAASDTQGSEAEAPDSRHTPENSKVKHEASQNDQSAGTGMDIDSILNLISLFQTPSNAASNEKDLSNVSERQDEPEHEQGLDER